MNAQPQNPKDNLHTSELPDNQQLKMGQDTHHSNISERYVYHITDRDNLTSIVSQGLKSASYQQKTGLGDKVKHLPTFFPFKPYENKVVIIDDKGREYRIDDCVQFVFTAKDPRLFNVINSKNIDQDRIIFLCMKADKVTRLGGCISDRYAKAAEYEPGEEPKFYADLMKADNVLDWPLIDSSDLGTKDSELKKTLFNWTKSAQAFIPEGLNFDEIEAIIVFNEEIKSLIQNELKTLGVDLDKIQILTEEEATAQLPIHPKFYWFKDKIIGHEKESLVTGPKELYHLYGSTRFCVGSSINLNRFDARTKAYKDQESTCNDIRISCIEIRFLSLVKLLLTFRLLS